MGYHDIIWYTNPGIDNNPVQQFRDWCNERETQDFHTKLGLLRISDISDDGKKISFNQPRLDGYLDDSKAKMVDMVIEWESVHSKFLSLIQLDSGTYFRLIKYKELTVLRKLMQVLQRHNSNRKNTFRLIKIPHSDYWTVRAIISKRYVEVTDLEVFETMLNTLKALEMKHEPVSIVVTKVMTRIRFVFPTLTFEIGDNIITLGFELVNSEVGMSSIKIEAIALINEDDGVIRIPYQRQKLIKHFQHKREELLAALISLFKDFKHDLPAYRDAIKYANEKGTMEVALYNQFCNDKRISGVLREIIERKWDGTQTRFSYACAFAAASVSDDPLMNYRTQLSFEQHAGTLIEPFMRYKDE